jgi:hypothetical protein
VVEQLTRGASKLLQKLLNFQVGDAHDLIKRKGPSTHNQEVFMTLARKSHVDVCGERVASTLSALAGAPLMEWLAHHPAGPRSSR